MLDSLIRGSSQQSIYSLRNSCKKLRESNVIFVNFHTRLQSTDFIVVVLVLRPRLNSDFEDEDEHEDEYEDEYDNNQIKSTANVLKPLVKLAKIKVYFSTKMAAFQASGWAEP